MAFLFIFPSENDGSDCQGVVGILDPHRNMLLHCGLHGDWMQVLGNKICLPWDQSLVILSFVSKPVLSLFTLEQIKGCALWPLVHWHNFHSIGIELFLSQKEVHAIQMSCMMSYGRLLRWEFCFLQTLLSTPSQRQECLQSDVWWAVPSLFSFFGTTTPIPTR
jgi:hypothetical protein